MPDEAIVSIILDCEIIKTVTGTIIIMTCEAAPAPARTIPPASICPIAYEKVFSCSLCI